MTVSETDIPAEGLATLDWLIIAAYVVGMIALG